MIEEMLTHHYWQTSVNPVNRSSGHLHNIMFTRHLSLVLFDELRVITDYFVDWHKIYGWNVLLSLLSPPCACMFWPLRLWTRKFCVAGERLCNFNFWPRGSCQSIMQIFNFFSQFIIICHFVTISISFLWSS